MTASFTGSRQNGSWGLTDRGSVFQMTESLANTQMPQIGWIDALRRYNLGGSSWCIPRKGSAEYDKVMMIRAGAEDVKPQPRRRIVKARLPVEKPEVVAEPPKTDRIAEINKQIEKELDAGVVSVAYDLGWKPDTTEEVYSGAVRAGQAGDYMYLMRLDELPTTLDTAAVNKIIDDPNEDKGRREFATALLKNIVAWKPRNVYSSRGGDYNTKTKTGGTNEVKPALDDYQQFADEVNAVRGTPIRNISYGTQFNPNGTRTLLAYWTIHRNYYDKVNKRGYDKIYRHFVREYQLTPEFKFVGGTTIKDIEKEEEEERKKTEGVKQKAVEKKQKVEEKAKDPLLLLKKELEDFTEKFKNVKYLSPEYRTLRDERDVVEKKIRVIEKERKALRKEMAKKK